MIKKYLEIYDELLQRAQPLQPSSNSETKLLLLLLLFLPATSWSLSLVFFSRLVQFSKLILFFFHSTGPL